MGPIVRLMCVFLKFEKNLRFVNFRPISNLPSPVYRARGLVTISYDGAITTSVLGYYGYVVTLVSIFTGGDSLFESIPCMQTDSLLDGYLIDMYIKSCTGISVKWIL